MAAPRFLVDAQLPPALARAIAERGYGARHVVEVGLRDADDPDVWDRASREGAAVITKDEDFATRRILATDGPTIVWVRIGNCSNRALMEWFMPLLDRIVERVESGEKLIEIV